MVKNKHFFAALLALLVSHTALGQVATDQDGQWFPGVVWVGDTPPLTTETAQLGHSISLDSGIAQGSTVTVRGLDFLEPGALNIANELTLDVTNGGTWIGSSLTMGASTALNLQGTFLLTDNNQSSPPRLHQGSGTGQIFLLPGATLDGTFGSGVLGSIHAQLNYPGTMFQWQGGSLIDGPVENLGQLNLAGTNLKSISGRLINSGTLVHAGSGDLRLLGFALQNGPGGVYNFVADSNIVNQSGAILVNQGILRKSAGAGTSDISVPVTGEAGGRVEVQTGSLQFTSSLTFDDTVYDVAAGAELLFSSGSSLVLTSDNSNNPAKVHTGSGAGRVRLLPGSTLDGTNGSGVSGVRAQLNFPGELLQWEGGTLVDGAIENINRLNLSGTEIKLISGQLVNSGLVVHGDTGQLNLIGNAVVNQAGAVYELVSDAALVNQSSGTFTNRGILRKVGGTGVSTIGVAVNGDSGNRIEVQAGSLQFDSTLTMDDTSYEVAANAELLFGSTSTLVLTSDNSSNPPKTHTGSGDGQVRFLPGSVLDGTFGSGVSGIRARLDFPDEMLQWEGGSLVDGAIENIGQLTLATAGTKSISGQLVNSSLIVHRDDGSLSLIGNGLVNETTGIYDLISDADIVNSSSGRITNRGILRKSGGTDTSNVGVRVDGESGGRVEVQSGTLQFDSLATFDDTTYVVEPDAELVFGNGGTLLLTSTNQSNSPPVHTGSGGGTVRLLPGSTLDGTNGSGVLGVRAQLDFPGAMLQWEGGSLLDGAIENVNQLNLSGAGAKTISGQLVNSSLIVHSDTGSLNLIGNGLVNQAGAVYDLVSDASIVNSSGGSITNRGTLRKGGGLGVSSINASIFGDPGGRVEVQAGTLQLDGPARFEDTLYSVSAGAELVVTNRLTLTLDNSLSAPALHTGFGTGRIRLVPGSILDGTNGSGVLGVRARLNFAGDLLQWEGGTLVDGAIENIGQLNLNTNDPKVISGQLRNQGRIVHDGSGPVNLFGNGLVNAASGVYEIIADGGIANSSGALITNRGEMRKTQSGGAAAISATLSNEGGLVVADAGTLDLTGPVTFTAGAFQVRDGASITFSQALNVPVDGIIGGTGTLDSTSFNVAGTIDPGQDVGVLTIAGDLDLQAGSSAVIEIDGLSNHDVIDVSGAVTTNGSFDVRFGGGFAPAMGDQFVIVTSSGLFGSLEIADFTFSGLKPGAEFSVTDVGGSIVVEALSDAEPGDTLTEVPPPIPLLPGDAFGSVVDVDGNVLVVGLPGMNGGEGAIAIYLIEGGEAVLDAMVPVPDGFSASGFGSTLAVSGDTIVVGTDGGEPTTQKIAGALAAAIFQRAANGGFGFKEPLTAPSSTAGDRFGSAVAISGDTVVVGAPEDGEDETTPSGAAYVFNRSNRSAGFTRTNKVKPTNRNTAARFGQAVAIRGRTMAVGAPRAKPNDPGTTSGSASIFDVVRGAATQVATATGSSSDDGAEFGASVDVGADGTVIVGAPMESSGPSRIGAAYLFGRQGEVFQETDRLQPEEPQPNGEFGRSVAIDPSGIVVGAPKSVAELIAAGIVHRYDRRTKQEGGTLRGKTGQTGFGTSVSIADGRIAIGSPNTAQFAGSASLFLDQGGVFRSGFE